MVGRRLGLVVAVVAVVGSSLVGGVSCFGTAPEVVVNTWPFVDATREAWSVLRTEDALTAVEKGVSVCEVEQCDHTVGYGGSPDEWGQTTLDAMIMNGDTMEAGSAVNLHATKQAISAARLVMETTNHTILAGRDADEFARAMGLAQGSLVTNFSKALWSQWERGACQPNYRRNVHPNPRDSCGPYAPNAGAGDRKGGVGAARSPVGTFGRNNHDTIAMIALNSRGSMAAGTSTNGATHKVPGRLADSGVPGSGAYVDSEVGGCGATGDGDVMMRFVPCYQVVESMRRGMSPKSAVEEALGRIRRRHPTFQGALLALDKNGNHAGATNCMDFHYSLASADHPDVRVIEVQASVPCPSST
ncbi:asparaginase [Chloropicon primus]|uniref:beta-aspartyl-peptidase n=2 Tax=Chloropicon primus TaxID=1764295 RepID=A0A5B8MUB2_9CHLO|nr:asparaginase [Chloropicon primus]UPR03117.1 asparaginase [Chloropicon primus]|eukprot:QDZ23906.1 asparaginase [Chloropicon primus]